jgi:hypothetical protein
LNPGPPNHVDALMSLPRYTESLIRQLIEFRPQVGSVGPKDLLRRFEVLWRALEPEDEFALILSWLGKCRLVHKLSQEQLPVTSTNIYRVPDLLAVFDHQGKTIPVLIEVKTSSQRGGSPSLKPGVLSGLKPGYLRYAETVGLPILVAWRHLTFWTLFEMRHATLAKVNYRIEFVRASEENLLSLLAGDFSYRIVPGSAICMRIEKLSAPDVDGSFKGIVSDAYCTNPSGERIPEIPHLSSLFLFLDNDVEEVDEGKAIVQRFVIRDTGLPEFASRTLPKIVDALAAVYRKDLDWRMIIHDIDHWDWAHATGEFRKTIDAASRLGVVTDIDRLRPKTRPAFL